MARKERRLRPLVGGVLAKLSPSDPSGLKEGPAASEAHIHGLNSVVIEYFDSVSLIKYASDEQVRRHVNGDLAFARRLVGGDPPKNTA